MQAGDLDRQIMIEQPTKNDNVFGEGLPEWSDLGEVWAKVEHSTGTEGVESEQIVASNTTTFTVRFWAVVTPSMRILYNEEYYDIESVRELGRQQWTEIKAAKRDNNNY